MAVRVRNELTIEEKLEVIDCLKEKRSSRKDIQERFNCNNTTISRILANEDRLRDTCNNKRRRIRSGHNGRIDEAVSRWFHLMREQNAFVNGPIIRKQAVKFARMMNINSFEANNGWLWRWQKKEKVDFKSLRAERRNKALKSFGNDGPHFIGDEDIVDLELKYLDWMRGQEVEDQVARDMGEVLYPAIEVDVDIKEDHDKNWKYGKGNTTIEIDSKGQMLDETYSTINVKREADNNDSMKEYAEEASLSDDDVANVMSDNDQSEIGCSKKEQRKNETNLPDDQRDKYSVYGEHIAHRFRSYIGDDYEKYIAQYKIDEIMFNLSMGVYKRTGKENVNSDKTTQTHAQKIDTLPQTINLTLEKDFNFPKSANILDGNPTDSQMVIKE